MKLTTAEIVTLIGISITFMVGIANLFISLHNTRKTAYINSITASRIKYIQDLRNSISRFCGLVSSYHLKTDKLESNVLFDLHKEADSIKFLVRLYLNPEDSYWDNDIMTLIDEILLLSDKDPLPKIEELITLTQYLLKLEWEGAKSESMSGVLPELRKKELYNKYVALHRQKRSTLKSNSTI